MSRARKLILLMVGFVSVVMVVTTFGQGGLWQIYQLYQENKKLEAANLILKQGNDSLRHEREALQKDRQYLERLARQELGLVKEGDVLYQFKEEPSPGR